MQTQCFTFGDFFERYIFYHTKFNIKQSLNLLFYGTPNSENITQSTASKIRKSGIPARSQLYHDYVGSDSPIDTIASNLKRMGLSGLPADGNELVESLLPFSIPNELKTELLQSSNIYYALSILLYYSVTTIHTFNKSPENDNAVVKLNTFPISITTTEFFDRMLENAPHDLHIDMAFHAGADFFRSEDEVAVFSMLLDLGAKIRVIVNTGKNAEAVVKNMRQPNHKYDTLQETYFDWTRLAEQSNGLLCVKTTELPLLHRMYVAYSNENYTYGLANAAFYTYGIYNPHLDIRYCYTVDHPEFALLRKEFEYLWNKCCKDADAQN
jgi:hypothetical protein